MADINIGAISEVLNNKVDLPVGDSQGGIDFVVDWQKPTAENNYTWYRKYKSGWIEQGGSLGYGNVAVNLPITMLGVDYTITLALTNGEDNNNTFGYHVHQITSTNFTVRTVYSGTQYNYRFSWQVSGIAA